MFLGSNLISWTSKKQTAVSRSSTEAEYRALAQATTELMWIQMLLHDLQVPLLSTPVLWCDNISAMALASNPVFYSRSKYIEVDVHFIREKVAHKKIQLKYIPTADQLADLLTKSLSISRFRCLKDKLMSVPDSMSLKGDNKETICTDKTEISLVS